MGCRAGCVMWRIRVFKMVVVASSQLFVKGALWLKFEELYLPPPTVLKEVDLNLVNVIVLPHKFKSAALMRLYWPFFFSSLFLGTTSSGASIGSNPCFCVLEQNIKPQLQNILLCKEAEHVVWTHLTCASVSSRLQSHCRWEPEADSGSGLDFDPALLHFHAHVGGRGWGGNCFVTSDWCTAIQRKDLRVNLCLFFWSGRVKDT